MPRIAIPGRDSWRNALWGAVAVGVLIRIVRYAADRSLWGDEGALALNIIQRSPRELLQTLDYLQGGPSGFLLAEKAATYVFGDSELSLRLVPLLGGIGALVLMALVARRMLRIEAAVLAVTLAALSDPLVYYSSEVKQYETDVVVALLLLYGAIAIDWSRVGWRVGIALAISGAVTVWFSLTALFVLPSFVAVLLVSAWRRRDRPALRTLVSLAVVWGVSSLAAFALNHGNTKAVASAALGSTGSVSRGFGEPVKGAWHAYSDIVGVANTATALAVVAAIAGLVVMSRRRAEHAALLVAPGALAFLAALAGQYPFSDRFILFLAPSLILLAADGAVALVAALPRALVPAGAAIVVLMLLYPVGVSAKRTLRPPGHEEVRTVLGTIERDWKPGDALFVWHQSQYPFRYYAECGDCGVLGRTGPASVVWPRRPRNLANDYALETHPPSLYVSAKSRDLWSYGEDFKPLAGRKRVWLLFSSTWDDEYVQQMLDCMGKKILESRATRAVAYLYDLSARPTGRGCVG